MGIDNIVIFGCGGFGREVYSYLMVDYPKSNLMFMVNDEFFHGQKNTIKFSEFDIDKHHVLICIGNPQERAKIVNSFPKETKWFTYIHKSIDINDNVIIGEGSIICPGSIITTNIKLGKHTHLNLLTTIGHDSIAGDFLTTAPGVKISGNCIIGNMVYFGTNSCIKEKISVCDNTTIGLNCGVVKDISESGTYIGTPAKKI